MGHTSRDGMVTKKRRSLGGQPVLVVSGYMQRKIRKGAWVWKACYWSPAPNLTVLGRNSYPGEPRFPEWIYPKHNVPGLIRGKPKRQDGVWAITLLRGDIHDLRSVFLRDEMFGHGSSVFRCGNGQHCALAFLHRARCFDRGSIARSWKKKKKAVFWFFLTDYRTQKVSRNLPRWRIACATLVGKKKGKMALSKVWGNILPFLQQAQVYFMWSTEEKNPLWMCCLCERLMRFEKLEGNRREFCLTISFGNENG